MATASRNARLIYTAESLARDTFEKITVSGNGAVEIMISLQKEFMAFSNLAIRQFQSLKATLDVWREQVQCGEVEFSSEREEEFKAAIHASMSFLSFLTETFNEHCQDGHFLMNPKRGVGLMETYKKQAERIMSQWQSPEWETDNERTVKWDNEQSSHLREKLSSAS